MRQRKTSCYGYHEQGSSAGKRDLRLDIIVIVPQGQLLIFDVGKNPILEPKITLVMKKRTISSYVAVTLRLLSLARLLPKLQFTITSSNITFF